MTDSKASASVPAPVPFAIARSMLSFGMRASLAFWTAFASEAFIAGSPPPSRAATWIARASFVKWAPRRASTTAFLCLIDAHLEWPDMASESRSVHCGWRFRLVAPSPAPELLALVRRQPSAHAHDRVDLLERCAAGYAL